MHVDFYLIKRRETEFTLTNEMTLTSKEDVLDSLIGKGSQCTLCGEKPRESMLLDCNHRLCLDCSKDYTTVVGDAENFQCPNGCQSTGVNTTKCPTVLDNMTPEGENICNGQMEQGGGECRLQSNLSNVTCSSCESDDVVATAVCDECEGFLCDDCVRAHTKLRRLMKTHNVLNLEDLVSGKAQMRSKARRCNVHPTERMNFFCSTCRILVCSQCAVIKHAMPDHECLDIETAKTNFENVMSNLFNRCESKLSEVMSRNSLVEKQRRDIDLEINTLEQIINSTADEIIDQINEKRRKLQSQLGEIKSTLVNKMDRIQGSNHFVIDKLTSAQKLISRKEKSGLQIEHCQADIFFDSVNETLARKEMDGDLEEVQEFIRRVGFKRSTSCSDQVAGAIGEIFQVSEWEVHRQYEFNAHVSAMTAFHDGRIAIACDDEQDGVMMVLTNGSKDRVLDGVIVKHIAALSDGQFVIIDHDNHLRLFSAHGKEDPAVVFKHPENHSENAVPVCVTEAQGQNILVGYSGLAACYAFKITGGKPTAEISTGDVCPKQLVTSDQDGMKVIAVNSPKVAVVDEAGKVLWRVEESNASTIVPAVFGDHVFIASTQPVGGDNGATNLTIDRYSVGGELIESLVQDEIIAVDEPPTQIEMIMISKVKLAVSIGKLCLVFNGPQALSDFAEEVCNP